MASSTADVVVVGGGMAGASAAYELAAGGAGDVVLVEAEEQLAHHTTGRSAAMFLPSYGNAVVRGLTRASRPDFDALAERFGLPPLLRPLPLLWVADEDSLPALHDGLANNPTLDAITPSEAVARCSCLRLDALVEAAVDERAMEIDVLALHGGYVAGLRAAGGRVVRGSPVRGLRRSGGVWEVSAGGTVLTAPTVVNAAGAWVDEVAALAGVAPVGITPLRRTLFTSPVTWPEPIDGWPLVLDAAERWYFKPEHDQLLVSPADETPVEPGDARPEPVDIARALEMVNERTTLGLRSVRSSWAGLRSFVADRTPVAGSAPGEDGFWWLAGQGGYGIQLAPALARTTAALILQGALPPDVAAEGVTEAALTPARFR